MIKLLLIIEAILALGMGTIVFANSPYSRLHRSYGLVSLFSSIWLISNALSINEGRSSVLLFAGHLITPASLLTTFMLSVFLRQLVRRSFYTDKIFFLLLLPNLILSALSFTSLNAYLNQQGQLQVGGMFPVFVAVLIANILFTLALLFSPLPHTAPPALRSQLAYMRFGLILSVIPAAIFGAILPLFGNNSLSNASPLFALIFLVLTALAIARHKLFDIRAVVARSFAYTGLITSLALIYAFIVEIVFTRLFGKGNLNRNEQIAYLLASLAIGFTLTPLKRFFDWWSRRIFYRDSYQPQQLLDTLNKSLVKDINLGRLLEKSASVIRENIKAEFVAFIILNKNGSPRTFGEKHFTLTDAELEMLAHSFRGGHKAIALSDLEPSGGLYELLNRHQMMVAGELRTRASRMGYILIGNKKSGNLYSRQDIQMIQLMEDELAIAVQNSLHVEEIERFNVTLQEKVDQATQQLRHANQRLKQLDQTKDEFISIASHQLRTPLTTIKGYLSMVLEGDVGPVTKNERQMIQQAFDSAERMVFLIADLLNVSRLQSGKFVIENKPTDLVKMVKTEVAQLQEVAKNHHLTLTLKQPDKLPLLNLDDTKIRQVIMNFIDNAIYYTPASGSIEVALGTTEREVRFTVTDTGLGVPKEAQHHLFSKFYRAGNARKMRPDGTGLGLFMAKKVITAQGGAIIFNSVEGKGSTFGFSFPLPKVELKSTPSEKPKETALAA